MRRESPLSKARRWRVIRAFNDLTASQKADLALLVPELYFAVAFYVRHQEGLDD